MDNSFCLYRRYRPKSFDDLVGQDHIKRTLVNSILSNRFVHAYLFSGPRGTGKTSTARLLAKALNCRDLDRATAEPCGKCPCCEKIDDDNFLDIIEIDAASHTGIANVREEIQAKVGYLPSMGTKKVYIIDEVHMLSTAAFNGLLKTLEEPPGHVVFVLATTEPHKVPPTVTSRCQRFSFRRVSDGALKSRLAHICRQEGIDAQEEALAIVARMAGGGARDAISLLDKVISFTGNTIRADDVGQALGIVSEEVQRSIVGAMIKGDLSTLVEVPATLDQEGFEMHRFAQELVYLAAAELKSLIVANGKNEARSASGSSDIQAPEGSLFEGFNAGDVVAFMDMMSEGAERVRKASDPLFQFQVELMKMSRALTGQTTVSAPMPLPTTTPASVSLSAAAVASPPAPRPSAPVTPAVAQVMVEKEYEDLGPVPSVPSAPSAPAVPAAPVVTVAPVAPVDTEPSASLGAPGPADDRLLESWPAILEGVRKSNPIVHALLKEGKPQGVFSGRLSVLFDKTHEFHRKQLCQDQYLVVVEGVMNRIMDTNLKVVFTSSEEQEPKKASGGGDIKQELMQDPKVKRILSICDGEIIKIIPKK